MSSLDLSLASLQLEDAVALAKRFDTDTCVTSLALRGNSFGPPAISTLAQGLMRNTALHSLDLRYNPLGPEGAASIANMLKENRSITVLNLHWTSLQDAGAELIAESLTDNTMLTTLDMGGNGLGLASGHAMLAALQENTALQQLALSSGLVPLIAFRDGCTTDLDLSDRCLRAADGILIAGLLQTNTVLLALNLDKNRFREVPSGTERDCVGDQVFRVDACDTVTRALEAALQVNTTLVRLSCRGRKLTAAGCKPSNSLEADAAAVLSAALTRNRLLACVVPGGQSTSSPLHAFFQSKLFDPGLFVEIMSMFYPTKDIKIPFSTGHRPRGSALQVKKSKKKTKKSKNENRFMHFQNRRNKAKQRDGERKSTRIGPRKAGHRKQKKGEKGRKCRQLH